MAVEENTIDKFVSVIIPCFNSMPFLREAVESVLAQTSFHGEIIIIDDASTDDTQAYVESIDSKHPIVFQSLAENSGGPATPRNTAISFAKGNYIAFLDADDIWHPNKLELQLEVFQHSHLDFCATRAITYSDTRPDFSLLDSERLGHSPILLTNLLRKNFIVNSSVLLRASKNLHFSTAKRHAAIEDYVAWLNLFDDRSYAGLTIEAPLVLYRVHESSISRSKLSMAKKIWALLSEHKVEGKKLGFRKYFYFFTYGLHSLRNLLGR